MQEKLKGSPQYGLWAATLGFFAGFAAVALFGPTAVKLREVMGLSSGEAALLVAIPALSGSLLRIPFGTWADKGARRPFLILMGLALLGMIGLSVLVLSRPLESMGREVYPLFLFFGFLSGCGIATFSVGITQVAYWFPKGRQGWALGFYAGVGNLAPGFFSLLMPVALTTLGLAGAYLAWTLFLALGLLLYVLWGLDAWYFQLKRRGWAEEEARRRSAELGQELFPTGRIWESIRVAALNWRTWALVALYFMTFGGFVALTAWFPTYWQELYGIPLLGAGALTAGYSLLTSGIRVFGGTLSDILERGGENTAILAFLIMTQGSVLLTLSEQFQVAVPGAFFMALGMGISNAAVFRMVPEVVPQAIGGASGLVGGLGALGGFVIPPIMGFAVTQHGQMGYPLGFVTFLFFGVVGLTLLWLLKYSPNAQETA